MIPREVEMAFDWTGLAGKKSVWAILRMGSALYKNLNFLQWQHL